jgi:predicted membrane metal-binding protein
VLCLLRKLPSFSAVIGIVLLVLFLIALGVGFQARRYGVIAAGYVARQMCSCLYVQNRTEQSCAADIGPQIKGAQIVYLEERVIVSYSGLNSAESRLTPGFGCSVQEFVGSMPVGSSKIVKYDE